MDIRTYRAASLQEALQFVREELGPDAAVLQTRQVHSGWMGVLGRRMVEVEASLEVPVARRYVRNATNAVVDLASATDTEVANDADEHELKNTLAEPSATETPLEPLSPTLLEALTAMLDAEVPPTLARDLLREVSIQFDQDQLADPWLVKGRLCQLVGHRLSVSGPIEVHPGQRKTVAFVGPTGVGKTTTLAKIAAGFAIDQGCQVGLISLDVFRVGAIDQLRKYAELVSAPIEIVCSADELPAAIDRMNDCQLILVDTAGRSPNDGEQIESLGEFLRVAKVDGVHLVLSATSSPNHARTTLERFAGLAPTHLLLTKLDEATALGNWLPLLSHSTLPLSYVTTGQRVPDDILVANRRRLASMILTPGSTLADFDETGK